MNHRFLAIEGNIGSGKSTLVGLLTQRFQTDTICEEFEKNPFLPKFYSDPVRYAFPLEMSFLMDRYRQIKSTFSGERNTPIIADYSFIKGKIFAEANLTPEEYRIFSPFFCILNEPLRKPDLIIYLDVPVAYLKKRIRGRGRTYEREISEEYLHRIQKSYEKHLSSYGSDILILDHVGEDVLDDNHLWKKLEDFY